MIGMYTPNTTSTWGQMMYPNYQQQSIQQSPQPAQQQSTPAPATDKPAVTSTVNNGWGQQQVMNPGQVFPNSQQGDNPLPNVQPGAPIANQQSFMPPQLMAPFYNAAGVAGNLGTMMGGVAPNSANFMNSMFDPNLNAMESSFMGAGLGNALVAMEQGFGKQQQQYEGTPFASGLMQSQNNVMEQTMRDLMQTSSQMGLQRESLGAQMANTPFQDTMAASQVAPQLTQQMFNMANVAQQLPYQEANTLWSGVPISSPTTVVSQGAPSKV